MQATGRVERDHPADAERFANSARRSARYGRHAFRSHAIVLIEAQGNRVINLAIPGCRPALSPDGKQIAWGANDHMIAAAPIDLDAETPAVGQWRLKIKDKKLEI